MPHRPESSFPICISNQSVVSCDSSLKLFLLIILFSDLPEGPVYEWETPNVLAITMKWKDWVHVTKLDPDKQLKPGDIEAIAASGTDALMLSGTLNVTKENLSALLKEVKAYNLPLVMEPAGPEAVLMKEIDYVFVPSVMNTTDVQWIVGKHRAWVQMAKGKIPWEVIVPEAYIVLNPNSSVGKVTKAVCDLKAEEVAAYATIADHYFHFPIVYIEYSGTFGDPGDRESRIGSSR